MCLEVLGCIVARMRFFFILNIASINSKFVMTATTAVLFLIFLSDIKKVIAQSILHANMTFRLRCSELNCHGEPQLG